MRTRNYVSAAGVMLVALTWGAVAPAADGPRLPAGGKPDTGGAKADGGPASGTKGEPAAAPTPGGKAELAGGQIRYAVPPEPWEFAKAGKTPARDAYVSGAHDAMLSVEVLPTGTTYTPDMAAAIVGQIKKQKAAKGTKFVQEPTVEKDDRFVIRIRERFQAGDKVCDQLHLYRQVGNRVVLVLANSLADADGAKEHHALGEATSLSAENSTAPARKPPANKKGK